MDRVADCEWRYRAMRRQTIQLFPAILLCLCGAVMMLGIAPRNADFAPVLRKPTPAPEHTPDRQTRLAIPVPMDTTPPAAGPSAAATVAEKPAGRIVRRIVLDPGHGGDTGALTPDARRSEDRIVFDVCERTADKLRADEGYEVLLTRKRAGDGPPTAEERAGTVNANDGDLLISVHCGVAPPGSRPAFAVFYCHDLLYARDRQGPLPRLQSPDSSWEEGYLPNMERSIVLARIVHRNLQDVVQAADMGVRPGRLPVLAASRAPAVLVEIGCLNDPRQAERLSTDRYLDALAGALVEGIGQYRAYIENDVGAPPDRIDRGGRR